MKSLLSTGGKFLYAAVMAFFGIGHFTKANDMAGWVPLPGGVIWVYITGAALILAAVAIFINKKASLATLLLGIMLVIFAVSIHLPGGESSMPNLLKDLGLAGAAFFMSSKLSD